MQYEKVPIVHYNLIDTDLRDESERQQQLDRIISSTAFTSNILAAYGGDTPAAKHPPKYSTHTVHVMAPNKQIRKIQCSPGTTLSAVLHSHYGTDEHRDTVMTSLGPFSGATKMSHFGAITGSQDAAERPEGLLMLSTEEAERVRPVALEVPVLVKKTGQKDESHVVYLSQDEVESTAVDIANIVCGDDYWNISAKSDTATGSLHLQQPVKFTVPYLKEVMGGNVTIVVSIDEPPPVTPPPTTQLPYDKATGKTSGPANGPARGSHRGSGLAAIPTSGEATETAETRAKMAGAQTTTTRARLHNKQHLWSRRHQSTSWTSCTWQSSRHQHRTSSLSTMCMRPPQQQTSTRLQAPPPSACSCATMACLVPGATPQLTMVGESSTACTTYRRAFPLAG